MEVRPSRPIYFTTPLILPYKCIYKHINVERDCTTTDWPINIQSQHRSLTLLYQNIHDLLLREKTCEWTGPVFQTIAIRTRWNYFPPKEIQVYHIFVFLTTTHDICFLVRSMWWSEAIVLEVFRDPPSNHILVCWWLSTWRHAKTRDQFQSEKTEFTHCLRKN